MGYLSNEPIEQFTERLKQWRLENDPCYKQYPKWLCKDFYEYWTQKNDGGRLHYYQMEKKWSTGLRLATWKKRTLKDPRWKQSQHVAYKPPQTSQSDYVPPLDYEKAKERLRNEPQQRGHLSKLIQQNLRR